MADYDASIPTQDFFPRIKDNFCLIVVGVVLRGNQVLLIQEAKHSCYGKYFLPAGRLEPHETLLFFLVCWKRTTSLLVEFCELVALFLVWPLGTSYRTYVDGVKREVLEESGLEFEPKQLVLLESNGSCWFSVTFIGEAVGGQLKTVPDMESLQACWFEVTDVQKAESDWFSLHRIHRPDRPVVGAAKPGSFQLRAPVMHMIEAARRFCPEMGLVVSCTIPLPDSRLCGLRCILFQFVVLWIRQSNLGTNDKPSHMLVRNTNPVRLPTFRINLIDPLKAITLALGTMLPTISSSSAFDVRRVGILKMTFVPRLADQLSDQTCTGDGFLLTLRICLIPETNSNLILPQTTDRFEWISIEPSSDALNTWSSELPNWMIQLPVNTDLLPLYRL